MDLGEIDPAFVSSHLAMVVARDDRFAVWSEQWDSMPDATDWLESLAFELCENIAPYQPERDDLVNCILDLSRLVLDYDVVSECPDGLPGTVANRWYSLHVANNDDWIGHPIFQPTWPEALQPRKTYVFHCDDEPQTRISVLVDSQGDVWVSASSPALDPDKGVASVGIRCRTGIGGGRHVRTRQAFVWLAEAIRQDNEALNPTSESSTSPDPDVSPQSSRRGKPGTNGT